MNRKDKTMNHTDQPTGQQPETTFLNIPIGPHPLRVPPEVMRKRRERAMDVEYAFFRPRYPHPVIVLELGDALVAIDPDTKKTLDHTIVLINQ